MSASTIINLIVNQRASFKVTFNAASLNLTDYTVRAKFKIDVTAPENTAVAFATAIEDPANGMFSISLTPEQTTVMQGKYYYDIVVTNNTTSFKTRLVEGKITVSGGIT